MSDGKKAEVSASAAAEYECLVPIDHRADRRIYPVGAVIKLDHLTPEQIERLVSRGFVRRLAPPPAAGAAA